MTLLSHIHGLLTDDLVGKTITLSAKAFTGDLDRSTPEMRSIINAIFLYSQVRVSMANAPASDAHLGKRSIPISENGKLMAHGL